MPAFNASDSASTAPLMTSQKRYTKSGIGGAGNIRKHTEVASQPTPSVTITHNNGPFSTGIGGAGNHREESATITYQEHLARLEIQQESAPTSWHHGIGGAGNCASSNASISSKTPSLVLSTRSNSSASALSSTEKIKQRLSEYFKPGKSTAG